MLYNHSTQATKTLTEILFKLVQSKVMPPKVTWVLPAGRQHCIEVMM